MVFLKYKKNSSTVLTTHKGTKFDKFVLAPLHGYFPWHLGGPKLRENVSLAERL